MAQFVTVIEFEGYINPGDMPVKNRVNAAITHPPFGFPVEGVAVYDVSDSPLYVLHKDINPTPELLAKVERFLQDWRAELDRRAAHACGAEARPASKRPQDDRGWQPD